MPFLILGFLLLFASPAEAGLRYAKELPVPLRKQFEGDLGVLQSLRTSNKLAFYQEVFGGGDGRAAHRFFMDRVSWVSFRSCGDGAVACASGSGTDATMWLTSVYQNNSVPQLKRLSLLLHKARHTEVINNWGHVFCPIPFLDAQGRDIVGSLTGVVLAGKPACDNVTLGSYGVEVIFTKNVAQFCSNCTEKSKQDALLYSRDSLQRIVNAAAKAQLERAR